MEEKATNKYSILQALKKNIETINDLRELDLKEVELTPKQRLALINFERYKISELNNQKSEVKFHIKYQQLQAMANLTPYVEFLKEEYFE